jgi:hypothetical protein
MGQQGAQRHAGVRRNEDAFRKAAVVRLVVLEAEMSYMIAKCEQKVIVAVMARAEELARFGHQVDHLLLIFGAHVQGVLAVGNHVDLMVDRLAGRREIDGAIELTGDDRRVNQQIQRDWLEGDLAARLTIDGQRGAEFPALGQQKLGLVIQLLSQNAGGIKDDLVPFKNGQLIGSRVAFSLNEVEAGVEMSYARRNIEMKGEDIEQIALPRDRLAAGLELEACDAADGAVWLVIAGNPFGIVDSQRAWFDWDHFMTAQELLLGPGRIDRERNGLRGAPGGSDDDETHDQQKE